MVPNHFCHCPSLIVEGVETSLRDRVRADKQDHLRHAQDLTPEGTRLMMQSGVSDGPLVAKAILKRLFPPRMTGQFQSHVDDFGEAIERAYEKRLQTANASP